MDPPLGALYTPPLRAATHRKDGAALQFNESHKASHERQSRETLQN